MSGRNCICPACDGTGVGQGDNDYCGFCGGDGTVPYEAIGTFQTYYPTAYAKHIARMRKREQT